MDIDELIDSFEILENWEDRYRYLIDLGEKLPDIDEKYKTDQWLVHGCQSQVWLIPHIENNKIYFEGTSDAIIVKGIIAVILIIYSNKSAKEIKEIEVENIFAKLGLGEHLSPSRRNGLVSMVEKIRFYADNL